MIYIVTFEGEQRAYTSRDNAIHCLAILGDRATMQAVKVYD